MTFKNTDEIITFVLQLQDMNNLEKMILSNFGVLNWRKMNVVVMTRQQ